jgi:hypothetical protein
MESEVNTVKCPNCGADIDINAVLAHQLSEQLKQDYDARLDEKEKEFRTRELKLQQAKDQLSKAQEELQEKVDTAVKSKLAAEKAILEKSLRKKIDEDKAEQLKAMEEELNQKSEELKNLNKLKADLSKLAREKNELRATIEAESEVKLNELLAQEKEKITNAEAEKAKLDVQKRDKLIADLQQRLEETTLKLEQGSNKLTGEVTEIELREFLRQAYPIDLVEDVPSGIRGADVMHTVKNSLGVPVGIILYERKQTQAFGKDWVSKLKEDGLKVKADALVLVTATMPKENSETHFKEGVWVCAPDDVPLLTMLLRDSLIKQSMALASQENKSDKMTLLYDYLVSSEFANQITGLLDSFRKMDKTLAKEKEDTMKRFAERESHLWQAKRSILGFYGRIEGIAADGLNQLTQQVKMLEEPNGE